VASIYFDVTDIVLYARRNSTVVGIPRVELNIISLLATKHGGAVVRCVFFDQKRQTMIEFDPSQRESGYEFDGESLLIDLGLAKASRIFPSEVQVKSFLKRYSNNKPLRSLKKVEIYLCSIFARSRLAKLGVKLRGAELGNRKAIPTSAIASMPPDSSYVCLGAVWFLPEVWQFAREHKQRGGKVVQMVYDLIPISHPHYYTPKEPPAFTAWLNSALEYATHIACISKWTERDLVKYAGDRNQHPVTKVVPLAHEFNGFDRASKVKPTPLVDNLKGKKYVLCVGTIEFRKNGIALLKIWERLIPQLGDRMPLLVFAGKYGKGGAEFQEVVSGSAILQRFVRVVHAPSDLELAWLYQNCFFSTYPSVFEGWGLPVGEAAWFGKYCVASSATSIPEVCGDLLEYVDPTDEASIEAGIVKAITDATYLAQREQQISDAKLKTWADVADDIFEFSA
jgi:glycosyltransferase involved in cell wall biosynthesis